VSLKSKIFGQSKRQYLDQSFHDYVMDLRDLEKLRDAAERRYRLERKPEVEAQVYNQKLLDTLERYDHMITIAQKSIIRLTEEKQPK
jgi:hypothetical protein